MSQEDIIESFGELLVADNYPPIAGKILGLFYTSNAKYLTFEEIKEGISVSKSATSKALTFLYTLNEVSYIYDENNSRLRLFYLDIKGSIDRFNSILNAYTVQTTLLKEIQKTRNNENEELNGFIEKSIAFNEEATVYMKQKLEFHYKEYLKEK
ncbi:hypothetical protein [Kordia sp.]|uniref:hypothetical protein n=1 Tax=Kordia sp. TaxID=1965332 RepID=UPI003D6B7F1F